jgi:hypothetical protein
MDRIPKVAFVMFQLAGLAAAQLPAGGIAGAVQDGLGACVAGARVKVVSTTTGLIRSTVTSEEGDYSIPALLPGGYELTVEASVSGARFAAPR